MRKTKAGEKRRDYLKLQSVNAYCNSDTLVFVPVWLVDEGCRIELLEGEIHRPPTFPHAPFFSDEFEAFQMDYLKFLRII